MNLSFSRIVLISIAVVVASGFGLLAHLVTKRAETPVLQGVEEVMVDVSILLRTEVELLLEQGQDPVPVLERSWQRMLKTPVVDAGLYSSRFSKDSLGKWRIQSSTANIYHRQKEGASLYAAYYDKEGILLWSSYEKLAQKVGQPMQQMRDVSRALQGEYGARSSRTNQDLPETSVLFTSLPVYHNGEIVGVVSIIKEQREVNSFIQELSGRLIVAVSLIGVGVTVFVLVVALWLLHPMKQLTYWAQQVELGKRVPLPQLGVGKRAAGLGKSLARMRSALEGRREIAEYARQVTHELKSPLAGIKASAELLSEPNLDAKTKVQLTEALNFEVKRSQQVLDSLHNLAYLEELESLGNPEKIDFLQLVKNSVLRRQIRAKAASVELKLETTLAQAFVFGEEALLEGAVDNLLENAIDFSPEGGVVRVQLKEFEQGWQLVILDQGDGIPEYALGRVFQRFYSLRKQEQGGKSSGLGLNLVEQTVELHGGWVLLENSKQGKGAVATLWLPGEL